MNKGKIVLGLGGTVDYEIYLEEDVINKLILDFKISNKELKNIESIDNMRDLLITVLNYIKSGKGGERFVKNSQLIIDFSKYFDYRISLGGTCVRAGIIQSAFGGSCILHLVSISDEVRDLLPKDITYICSAEQDTLDPHLIIQFKEGFKFKIQDAVFEAPQPSRLIFTNDPPNRELKISEKLGEVLAQAPLFLISGFNCIQDLNILEMRISEVKKQIKKLPQGAQVIFEDAGYHLPEICSQALILLQGCLDIYSMNEDELQVYAKRAIDLLNVEDVYDAILHVSQTIPAPLLIVHTRYWALAYGNEADKSRVHLQAAIDIASTRFCYGENIGRSELHLTQHQPKHIESKKFSSQLESKFSGRGICLPGYDLKVENPTTIGLGDVFIGGLVGSLSGIKF
jgi:ADP-dependent phosphofructokinase/glucokinase